MSALRDLIDANPDALAAVQARDDAAASTLLNTPSQTVPKPQSRLTELGTLDVLIMAHAMNGSPDPATAANNDLTAVENAAEAQGAQALLSRAVRILKDVAGQGLDFGNLATQAMIAQLRDTTILSTVGANALLAFGSQTLSPAQLALGREVTSEEIAKEYVVDRVAEDNENNVIDRYDDLLGAQEALDADPDNPALQAIRDQLLKRLNETLGGAALKAAHQSYLNTKYAYENPTIPEEATQEEIDQIMADLLAAYQSAETALQNTMGGAGYVE